MGDKVTPLERLYNKLLDTQWWSRDRLVTLQRTKLTSLLSHASQTSPFYKTRLDSLYRANGTIDWDRWTDLPILSRVTLSTEGASIQSGKPLMDHGPFSSVKTSGSTGDPVEFIITRQMNDISLASLWRGQAWAGFDWSDSIVHIGLNSPKYKLGDNMGPWGPPWLQEAAKGKRLFGTYFDPPADRVALLKKTGAGYAALTDGMATSVAEYIRNSGTQLQMKGIQFIGGKATEFIRKDFKELLNADILELYSSKEGGSMASPCPMGHGWHSHAESVLMEVVDDFGKPVAPGQMGRVVITALDNYATPLIRYDQGDIAVAGALETCPCGRTLPRITSFFGRYRHTFRRPNGGTIPDLSQEARVLLGAGLWQVAKIGEHSYEMRYKKRDWGVPPNMGAFMENFYSEYYPEAQLTFVEVDNFVLGPTGKHMDRVDLWNPSSQTGIL